MKLTKQQAVRLFGGQVKGLAAALGLTSSAISQWPEELSPQRADRVIGAAVRLGVIETVPGGGWRRVADSMAEAA